jgi:hypothetical protein
VKRSFVVVLVVIPLLVAGCAGSGATPRTAAGVREEYRSFVRLLAAGEGKRACAEYVSAAVKIALAADKRGSCSVWVESGWTKGNRTVSGATAALKVVHVNGTRAAITTKSGSATMVYAAGHWQDNSYAYTATATGPNGETFSLTRHPDGSITRTCKPIGSPGCSSAGTW